MVKKKTWQEFRDSGLVLLLNQFLHIFGWAIVFEISQGEIVSCYPARVKFRGFDEKSQGEAYEKVTDYMVKTANELKEEIKE